MKHEPCDILQMQKINNENTICETLRQAYHMTEDDNIRLKLRIAVTMAKRMDRKLRKYKANWDKRFWESNFQS